MYAPETSSKLRLDRTPYIPPLFRSGYALAVILVFLANLGTPLFHALINRTPPTYVLFLAAVAISAGVGGIWPGILATLLSVLTCAYFLPPANSFFVTSAEAPRLVMFIVGALLFNALSVQFTARYRQVDQRYFKLLQGLDAIAWEMDTRTKRVTFVSKQTERILGYPIWTLLTDPDFRIRISHPSDAPRITELLERAMVMGGEHTAEYRVLTVDRREIWLRETIFIEHDLLGRLNRVTGVGFDITARKKEAEELARTRGEFAFLLAIASASQSSLDEVDAGALLKTELKQHLGIVTGRLYIDQQFNGELKCIDSWGAESAHTELWDSHIGERYGALTAAQLAADKQFGVTEIGSRIAPDGSEDGAGRQAIAIPLLDNKQLWGVLVVMCPTQWVMNGEGMESFAFLGREIGVHLRKSFVALPPFEEGTP